MAGKRLLPLLGGSSAVWITCLVFFQTALLLGYLCAHGIATTLRPRAQALVYALLLVVSLGQVATNLNPQLHASTVRPIFSVLWLLSALIGLPFLVLSATNPLLQAWYSRAGRSRDAAGNPVAPTPPYRLFALSNFGSLLALIIYPALIEPYFSLRVQTLVWSAGFLIFVVVCGAISFRGTKLTDDSATTPAAEPPADIPPAPPAVESDRIPTLRDRILWLLLAACGSLLLSAVTSHLSQNIAAIPLLWIVPLTIYLLTFVIAFNGAKLYWRFGMVRMYPVALLLPVALGSLAYMIADPDKDVPIAISVPLFCVALFIACLFCHGELYRLRPPPRYTTKYYLLIAAGGALGSIFVGVWVPFVLRGPYELAWSLVYTGVLAGVVMWKEHWGWGVFWAAASVALLVAVVKQVNAYSENTIVQVRSFYGTLRVLQGTTEEGELYRSLIHGTIEHGTQYYGSDEDRTTPTTYYAHNSGVGLALDLCCKGRPRRAGMIGLGAGTLAAYGKPGDVFRFYEIDRRVEPIARNAFSYLRESKAKIEIVEGDARLSMEAEHPQQYDVIAVDAFSGDAIPVHLLTAEALQLYLRHLRPDGILAFHVSNNYLDLVPVVADEAEHAGMSSVLISSPSDEYTGAYVADWVLVTTNKEFLSLPAVTEAASEIDPRPGLRLWTDDYSSLLPILKLKLPPKKD